MPAGLLSYSSAQIRRAPRTPLNTRYTALAETLAEKWKPALLWLSYDASGTCGKRLFHPKNGLSGECGAHDRLGLLTISRRIGEVPPNPPMWGLLAKTVSALLLNSAPRLRRRRPT